MALNEEDKGNKHESPSDGILAQAMGTINGSSSMAEGLKSFQEVMRTAPPPKDLPPERLKAYQAWQAFWTAEKQRSNT